jgi:cytochrome P450
MVCFSSGRFVRHIDLVPLTNDDVELIDRRIQQALDEQKSGKLSERNFLTNLVEQTQDREELRSELLNNLMAGRDTTASTLTNAWFEMSKRPRIWEKLSSEIRAIVKDQKPTANQLNDLPYLRAVLNESMRMYPQIPENGRIALEETILPTGGGPDGKLPVLVPKGGIAMWGNYVLQRQKDIFGFDADEFVPERWLHEEGKDALNPGFAYLSFGAGPRQCMGRKLIQTLQTCL